MNMPGALDAAVVRGGDFDRVAAHLAEVQRLLSRHRLVENLVRRQQMPRHQLVESVVQKQNLAELGQLLTRIDPVDTALILEALAPEDRRLAWAQVGAERHEAVMLLLLDDVRANLIDVASFASDHRAAAFFELHEGRLRQAKFTHPDDLQAIRPLWVDLVAPSAELRYLIGKRFGVALPDPEALTDLEATARFYVDDGGELHLHSDFLLERSGSAVSVPVAFILHGEILFSVRKEELPVFRLQRLRARAQPGYVKDGKDVLLDLYAADAEHSADALEGVYTALDVSRTVLNPRVSDDEAARVLSDIARSEDVNGRIRRNALDTRRALSFLMRTRALSAEQQNDAREIVRDIESLDSHTTFLFGKINFVMDATVGFISLNQNRRVSRLTSASLVFLPMNILAGIGGMSELSSAGRELDIALPAVYGAFVLCCAFVGWATYELLRIVEGRSARRHLRARALRAGPGDEPSAGGR